MEKRKMHSIIGFCICIAAILFCALIGSLVQTSGWKSQITDLRDATNTGTIIRKASDKNEEKAYKITGKVVSGILTVPKNATKDHPAPAIVFTHGVYNNREMQEEFAIEMARRGFVTLMIDREASGHNDTVSSNNSGDVLLDAAKYMCNLTDKEGNHIVDLDKIAVAGHSFAGIVIRGVLGLDSPEATASIQVTETVGRSTKVSAKNLVGNSDEALSYGYHMGIISAALIQGCADYSVVYSSAVKAVGEIKGNSDDMYDACQTKNPVYAAVARNVLTSADFYAGVNGKYSGSVDGKLYYKKGSSYVAVTAGDNYKKSTQYYRYSTNANSMYYLQSVQGMKFAGINYTGITEEQYKLVNGGIYDYKTGTLLAQPAKEYKYLKANSKLVSTQTKGQQLATDSNSLRVYYESRNIHQMIPFSTETAAQCVDFFYAAYGVPEGARYIAPGNQTWLIKEGAGAIGIIALFIMLIFIVDFALSSSFFSSLKAKDEDIYTGAPILKDPVRQIFYWLTAILTGLFGGWFYCFKLDGYYKNSLLKPLLERETGIFTNLTYSRWTEVFRMAYWGIICAIFAVCLTILFWCIKRVINMIRYKDAYADYDEHPFAGLRIRSTGNAFKTVLLASGLVAAFYLVVFGLWKWLVVDFRIWTFDIRIFKGNRLLSYLSYVPYFLVFFLINGALSQNYRVKDLPEWLTIIINVCVNVLVVTLIIWYSNEYYMNHGVVIDNTIWKNFCYAYPLIPSVGLSTIVQRRIYTRTGNAWLSAMTCATICTIISCANQCLGVGI
jgi:hypothetical protein